jgi:hypothetical protein
MRKLLQIKLATLTGFEPVFYCCSCPRAFELHRRIVKKHKQNSWR